MTDRQKAEIARAQQASAKFIRDGGLANPNPQSEVHKSSWELLAIINERGMLTYGSQDAVDSRTGKVKDYERCYITAAMLDTDETYQLVERFNLWSDSMTAYICVNANDDVYLENRTKKIAVSLRFDKKRGGWYTSMSLPLVKDSIWDLVLRDDFDLTRELPIVEVNFIDSKWGRPAIAANGLFSAVLQALDPSVVHPRRSRHPPPPFVRINRPTDEEQAEIFASWEAQS